MDEFKVRQCAVCEFFVPFPELRQCTTCRGTQGSGAIFFCLRTCSEKSCRTKNCESHKSCWDTHIPNYGSARGQHQMIDPLPDLFINAVIYSERDELKQQRLHAADEEARWFTIKPDPSEGGYARLSVSDRYRELCNPGVFDNKWSLNQFPGFVSFIGETCVGKSTILRAMLLMGCVQAAGIMHRPEDGDDEVDKMIAALDEILTRGADGPVSRGGSLNHLTYPTSIGVHLYKDVPGASSIQHSSDRNPDHTFPILFADCEGFRSGLATTAAERSGLRPNTHSHRGRSHSTMNHGLQDLDDGCGWLGHKSGFNLMSDQPITAPSYDTPGKDGAELFYARFLYTVSDVIIFVTKNDTTFFLEMQRVLEWAASAVYKAINQNAQKTLIVVRNMAGMHREELYDEGILKESFFWNLNDLCIGSKTLTRLREVHNSKHTRTSEQISNNKDLFRTLFKSVRACYIPNKDNVDVNTIDVFNQYRKLRGQIEHASQEGQDARSRGWMQYNVPSLALILNRAFEHFRTSDIPFDFYHAARNDNPNPVSMSGHIANFLRHASEVENKPNDWEAKVKRVLAISLVSWALRTFTDHFYEPESMLENDLRLIYKEGIAIFREKYEACGFIFPDQSACAVRGQLVHEQHCDSKDGRQPGNFVEAFSLDDSFSTHVEVQFINIYRELCTGTGAHQSLPSPEQSRALRERLFGQSVDLMKKIRSNKTCLTCLQEVLDHVLICGHGYCPYCVKELGKKSDKIEYGWVMSHCVLCDEHVLEHPQLIRLTPRCAGIRVLTLDGGGIRGVIELALLEELDAKVGLGIPVRDLFDLIVGTSTGGIVALGLASLDKKVPEMKQKFMQLASGTFAHRNEGRAITRLDSFKVFSKIGMLLRIWDSVYPSEPLKNQLVELFGKNTKLFSAAPTTKQQRSVRVAVTSVKNKGADFCLIANYNRPNLSTADDFEREDEDAKDFKTWEAGLATAAAPFYFCSYEKPETLKDYVDGALEANFPVRHALDEMNKVWTRSKGLVPSLDVLVSVGTGIQAHKGMEIPSLLKVGGFDKICTSFHSNIDSHRAWKKFEAEMTSKNSSILDRTYRLNAHITGDYVALDQYRVMEILNKMVKEQMKPDGEKESQLSTQIRVLAEVLIAKLFYFEPDDIKKPHQYLSSDNERVHHILPGSIRCRLAFNSPALKQLVNRISGFRHIAYVKRYPDSSEQLVWNQIPYGDEHRRAVRVNGEGFRVDHTIRTFEPDDAQQMIVVVFNDGVLSERNSISGFPVSLNCLKERAFSD